MKKLVFLSFGILALALQPTANAQTPTTLFSTYDDFSTWNAGWGSAPVADNTFSFDGSTVDGLANPTTPGAAGTAGSLQVTAGAGATGGVWTYAANSAGINGAAVAAVDPGYLGDGVAQPATGNFYVDFSLPDNEAGSYFQVGVLLQYAGNGYWGPAFSASATDLGFTDANGLECYQATIPYSISAGGAGSLWGFGFGLMLSTDYQSVLPFNIGAISVSAVPEPGTIALIGMGLSGLMFIRRRQS